MEAIFNDEAAVIEPQPDGEKKDGKTCESEG
jgi:hypothetical protein